MEVTVHYKITFSDAELRMLSLLREAKGKAIEIRGHGYNRNFRELAMKLENAGCLLWVTNDNRKVGLFKDNPQLTEEQRTVWVQKQAVR